MNILNTETLAYRSEAAVRAEYAARDFSPLFFPYPPDVRVADSARPSFDALTQDVAESDPALVGGAWTQQWSVVALASDVAAARRSSAIAQATVSIKAERDRRQQEGGVKVGSNWFLSSDREAGRYNILIGIAVATGAPGDFVLRAGWRTMVDGVTQDMTLNLARQILSAGMTQFAAIDDAAQAHIAAMGQATDPLAYDFSGNWPLGFGEQP